MPCHQGLRHDQAISLLALGCEFVALNRARTAMNQQAEGQMFAGRILIFMLILHELRVFCGSGATLSNVRWFFVAKFQYVSRCELLAHIAIPG